MTQFVFISHGGGPLPLLGDPNHVELIQYLRQLSQDLEALKQILVISAHWEASEIQITHHSNPPCFTPAVSILGFSALIVLARLRQVA